MCYVHNQWYDILCATLYFLVCNGILEFDIVENVVNFLL